MTESLRRTDGELVRITGFRGFKDFTGAVGRIREGDSPEECSHCCYLEKSNLDCQEWPNVDLLDPDGRPTGEQAYHVPECAMEAVTVGEQK